MIVKLIIQILQVQKSLQKQFILLALVFIANHIIMTQKKMSLLFTHAYYISDDLKEQRIMKPYPPLGLLYVSAYLKSKNIANEVFDSTFSSQEKQLNFIFEKQPTIIFIYTNLMTKVEVVKLLKLLKTKKSLLINAPILNLEYTLLENKAFSFASEPKVVLK